MSNLEAVAFASFLKVSKTASSLRILIAFMSHFIYEPPTGLKKPDTPSILTSGIPPELLEMTGTPDAIASKAANPKLSV